MLQYKKAHGTIQHVHKILDTEAEPKMKALLNQCDDFPCVVEKRDVIFILEYLSTPPLGTILSWKADGLSNILEETRKLATQVSTSETIFDKIKYLAGRSPLHFVTADFSKEILAINESFENEQESVRVYAFAVEYFHSSVEYVEKSLHKSFEMVITDSYKGYTREAFAPLYNDYGTLNRERVQFLFSKDINRISDAEYKELAQAMEGIQLEKDMELFIRAAYQNRKLVNVIYSTTLRVDIYQYQYTVSPVFVEVVERYRGKIKQELIEKGFVFCSYADLDEGFRFQMSKYGIMKGMCDNFSTIDQNRNNKEDAMSISVKNIGVEKRPYSYSVGLPSNQMNATGATFYVFDATYKPDRQINSVMKDAYGRELKDLGGAYMDGILSNFEAYTIATVTEKAVTGVVSNVSGFLFFVNAAIWMGQGNEMVNNESQVLNTKIENMNLEEFMDNFYMAGQVTSNTDGSISTNFLTSDYQRVNLSRYACARSNKSSELLASPEDYFDWCKSETVAKEESIRADLEKALDRVKASGEYPEYQDIEEILELNPEDWAIS